MAKQWITDDPDPVTEAVQLVYPPTTPQPSPGGRHAAHRRPRRVAPVVAGMALIVATVTAAVITRHQPDPPPVSSAAQGTARTSSWPVRPSDTSMAVQEDGPTTRPRSGCAPTPTGQSR